MFRQLRTLLVSFFVLTMCSLGYAQSAQIQGQVTDISGAVIPKSQLRVVDQKTGAERKTETNASGQYAVPGLTPSLYKVFVQASGFSGAISNPITLNVEQNAVLDFKLQVGSASSEVIVDAGNININTTDGSVSTVIDRQFVENLPLNGRSFQSLLYLTPGVAPNVAASETDLAQGQFVVNGQRGDANYWMVDGVGANIGLSQFQPGPGVSGALGGGNVLGGTSALVSIDAMQEFRFQTSSFAPEYGRVMGGHISIQTRSGTNKFHGVLFDYLRNGDLDSSDWFANHNGLPKPLEIQNDYGGVLGGPLWKDKTFFFLSVEGLRLRLPQTFLGTVPDLAARATAVPGVAPYMNAYPTPDANAVDVSPGLAPFNRTYSNPGSADAYSLRLDHQLLSNLNVFARYNHAPSSVVQRGGDGTIGNSTLSIKSTTKTATAGAVWTINPQFVDDARFNYSEAGGKSYFDVLPEDGSTGFPSTNPFAVGSGLDFQSGDLYVLPIFGTNMRLWKGPVVFDKQHHYNFVDTLTWQKGPHTLKFGGDYRLLKPVIGGAIQQVLPFFDTLENFAAGNSYFAEVDYLPTAYIRFQNLGLYAQDTWRVTPRLNLTYGLRWDVDYAPGFPKGETLAAITGYSTTDFSKLAIAPAGTQPYSTKYGNLAPRIGAAYRLRTSPDWGVILRGGFGVFYGLSSTEIYNATYTEAYYPTAALTTFSNITFPLTPENSVLPAIEPPNIQNGETLGAFDPGLNVPYALQWNAALEFSVGKAQTVSLSYVGAADRRLVASEFINNPNANYASAYLVGNAGTLDYNAMQIQFVRRLSRGLQASLSYTWSHSIDTGSYGEYRNGSFADVNLNRGSSDYDVRNGFTGAVTYNIPALQQNAFVRAITGGWATDNVIVAHSGTPIDVQDAAFTALTQENAAIMIRPDIVPGQPFYLTGSQYPGHKAINPAAFTDPPIDPVSKVPTRQGNLPRNALRSLGYAQWDFALHRDITLHEGIKLQMRGELFNIFNHPNFAPFNSQLQAGNVFFGQSTQMLNQYLGGISGNGGQNPLYTPGSPRSGELALKLVF
jgi:Carboxypeptidase regulatory-like domain